MRSLLIIIFSISILNCYSQTIEELELDLRSYKSDEGWGKKKDKALELIALDKFNIIAIDYILQLYDDSNQKDSITFFFEKLIKENIESPVPYIIRVQLSKYESLNYTKKINYLKKAYNLDSANIEVNYSLAKLYYILFNKEFKKNRKKENLGYYARNSIIYLTNLCSVDYRYIETLKYPLIQLSNYLGDKKDIAKYKNYKFQSLYFPISEFAELPNDWMTNYGFDVINNIESAIFHINWYSKHLKALEEPVLTDSLSTKIFRFTWLRTFHNPIVIRLENNNDTISLYWKVCDGAGGYSPGKLIINERKKLTQKDWENFISKVKSINFWNLQTVENEFLGTDGAQWILEGKEFKKYHVVDRWSGGKIGPICIDLLKLTDLKIKDDDIY